MSSGELTPDQGAEVVFAALANVPEKDLEERVDALLDACFRQGCPDVAAAMWRRSGLSEDRVLAAVEAAAVRLDRDPDMCLELVYGDWG